MAEYAKELRGFSVADLENGWSWLKKTYKRRDWPTILDLNEAMKAVRPARAVRSQPSYVPEPDLRTPAQKAKMSKLFAIWHKHGQSCIDTWNDPEFRAECPDMPEPRIYPIDPVMEAWQQDKRVMDRVQASDAGASDVLKALVAKQRASA